MKSHHHEGSAEGQSWLLWIFTVRSQLTEPIFGQGIRRSAFSVKKGVFSEEGGGNSVNQGFGKDFYRKGNSVKRSGPFSEPPDSENWKVAVQIHFPKSAPKIVAYLPKLHFLELGGRKCTDTDTDL